MSCLLLLLAFLMVFTTSWPIISMANKLPASELTALDNYPNWVGACGASTDNTDSGGVSGDVQDLAKQVLSNKNIDKDSGRVVREDLEQAAAGKPSVGNNKLNPYILGATLEIAKEHKVSISSITGNGSGHSGGSKHYVGLAVDFQSLDGKSTNGSDAAAQTIVTAAGKVMPKGSSFGLGSSPGSIKLPSGMSSFGDFPNHVHMQAPAGGPDRIQGSKDSSADSESGGSGGTSASGDASGSSSGCCPRGGAGGGTSTGKPVGKNEYSAGDEYAFLVGEMKLSPIAAAAITGNAIWESGGSADKLTVVTSNPSSVGANGIHQWYQGRLTSLKALADKQNKSWTDLGVQLDYLKSELTGGYKAVLSAVKAQKTIASATTTFEAKFEISGDTGSYPTRIALAKKVLKKFGGASSSSTGEGEGCPDSSATDTGEYKNPFRDVKKLQRLRIDQGIDMFATGPYYAIGPGKVFAATTSSGWPGGNFIGYTLTDGPAKGKHVFMAENCKPKVKVGDKVNSDTVICELYADHSPWSETGWAAGPSAGYSAAAHTCYSTGGSTNTAYGVNFSELMKKLGGPAGVPQKTGTTCKLPSGWPQWK